MHKQWDFGNILIIKDYLFIYRFLALGDFPKTYIAVWEL